MGKKCSISTLVIIFADKKTEIDNYKRKLL